MCPTDWDYKLTNERSEIIKANKCNNIMGCGQLLHREVNHLTPELNPSAQRCLPRFFTGNFNF
jgi:hypothetical protein